MAPVMIQHPDNENRIVELVRSAIAREDVSRIVFIVAWIQTKAMDALREPIRHAAIAKKEIVLIFGDNPRARFHDKPALETLLDLQSRYQNITIYRHRAGVLFHPKLYYVAGKDDSPANIILGSANFTGAGLGINQNRNINNVELVVHGDLAVDSEDRIDVERLIRFLIENDRSIVLDQDWVGKYKQMKPFDNQKKRSLWKRVVKWVKNKFRKSRRLFEKSIGGKSKTVAGDLESKSTSKSLPTSEESLDTSGEVVTINQMSLQELVSQIEIEVSNESSNNWVVTRMRERSHGDGNNSAKYLSIVPLTAHFLLHMDESDRNSLLTAIRNNTSFSCNDGEWPQIRDSMPTNIRQLFAAYVRNPAIQNQSIYRIRRGEKTVEEIRRLFGSGWGGTASSNSPPEPRWTLYLIAHRIWEQGQV